MAKLKLDKCTREQLVRALMAAGVQGISRLRKDELVGMAMKMRGTAREALIAALPETAVSDVAPDVKTAKPARAMKRAKAVEPPCGIEPPAEHAVGAEFATERHGPVVVQIPPPGDYPLPDSYGIDLFHVLVFDPYSAYLFWELSPDHLAHLYSEIGEEMWRTRRLAVRVVSSSGKQSLHELYGERSSYYLQVREPGESVTFELGLLLGTNFMPVAPARTVAFPRDSESIDRTVRMMEVKAALSGLSIRELSRGEVEEVSPEALGAEEYGLEAGGAPSSLENLKAGEGK